MGARQHPAKAEAKRLGEPTYFTGKPCNRGHIAHRYVINGACLECVPIRNRAGYERHLDKRKAEQRAYHYANREACIERARDWYERNRDVANANKRAWYAAQPREDQLAQRRAHYVANSAKYKQLALERYVKKMRAMPAWADRDAIESFYEEARRLTAETGIQHAVDHIVPLQGKTVSGLHVENNLRVITQTENLRKSNKLVA